MIKTRKQGVYYNDLKNGDKVFYIKYSLDNKQYKTRLGTDRDGWSTHKAYRERERRISNSIVNNPIVNSMTLNKAYEAYVESIAHKTDSYNTRCRYNTHIRNVLGAYKLQDIKPIMILDFKATLSTNPSKKTGKILAKRTRNGLFDLINQIYNFHIRIENYKGDSPATPKLVERYKENNTRLGFLSKDDYNSLIDRIEHRAEYYENTKPYITKQLLLFVKLGVTTGARRGTLLTIQKKDINFKDNTIALYNHKLGRAYQGYIHPNIKDWLIESLSDMDDESYVIGGKRKILAPTTISKKLQPILNDLFNVGVTDRRYRIVIHSLRHTFGSWLAQANTSLYQIMKLLDHSRIEQTQMYSKLLPNSGANEVSKIDILG